MIECGASVEWYWRDKGEELGEKPATLYATNSTGTVLVANQGLRGEKPMTDRLNYVTLPFAFQNCHQTSLSGGRTCESRSMPPPAIVAGLIWKSMNQAYCFSFSSNDIASVTGSWHMKLVCHILQWRLIFFALNISLHFFVPQTEYGPTFCDSWTNLYNAANMAGRKQNTKIMAMVKIKH
jgi:hypothetical protein